MQVYFLGNKQGSRKNLDVVWIRCSPDKPSWYFCCFCSHGNSGILHVKHTINPENVWQSFLCCMNICFIVRCVTHFCKLTAHMKSLLLNWKLNWILYLPRSQQIRYFNEINLWHHYITSGLTISMVRTRTLTVGHTYNWAWTQPPYALLKHSYPANYF